MLHLAMSPENATCERVFSVSNGGGGACVVYGHWLYSRMFLCSFGSVFQFACPPLSVADPPPPISFIKGETILTSRSRTDSPMCGLVSCPAPSNAKARRGLDKRV